MKEIVFTLTVAFVSATSAASQLSLMPESWPAAERNRLEHLENLTWAPREAIEVESSGGLVSATVSPIAVYAGVQALRMGGTAADAAATVALTQVATQLGSTVSYAGVFTMLYYDAGEKAVHSMDAGFNTYANETDPLSILKSDLGPLNFQNPTTEDNKQGRTTLVPGFMAGIEAMHNRFGNLPFYDLFSPSIWYCENGIRISPTLSSFFQMRKHSFMRTREGQRFLSQSGGALPKTGDLFMQTELADTLRGVAGEGSQFMYTGTWAKQFVNAVQHEGGKATLTDMRSYQPIWAEPHQNTAFGCKIYVNAPPHYGAYGIVAGLNIAEARRLDEKDPYWSSPETFLDLVRISQLLASAPTLSPDITKQLNELGILTSPDALLNKEFAKRVSPLLEQLHPVSADRSPKHSNAIVAIDKAGNIAVVTHTINTVVWGSSGIVVGGIPLPDSAGFQQQAMAAILPGSRLPHQIVDTIVLRENQPVLATASIGASLMPETLRILVSVLGQKRKLTKVMAAPPLLMNFPALDSEDERSLSIPNTGYHPNFVATLKELHPKLELTTPENVAALRGTVAAIAIDPQTGNRSAANQPGVMVFNIPE